MLIVNNYSRWCVNTCTIIVDSKEVTSSQDESSATKYVQGCTLAFYSGLVPDDFIQHKGTPAP